MKPKPREKRKKLVTIDLSKMTCSQLVEWLRKPAEEPESKKCHQLRNYYSIPRRVELLRLCGSLKATHHYAHCMTARHLSSVPTIKMEVAGGKPDETKMPRFTAALKRLAAQNGIVIHRWGKGAFILWHPLKEERSAREE